MKNILKYMGSLLFAAVVMASCSPEDYAGLDPNGIPNATDADVTVTTDQEINQVTMTLNNPAMYPVWIVDGKTYSTRNPFQKINAGAGDYNVELKLGNRNGVSAASVTKTYHFDNTKIDLKSFVNRLTGGSSKQWYIASTEAAHLGCGEPGTDGTGWWSAQPNEKAAWGVYDDVLTFTSDGKYTYDPGEGGTVYVNKACTVLPVPTGATADVMIPVQKQESTYEFTTEGNDIYLTFPAQTLFPYIANDNQYKTPKFKLESATLTSKKMSLIFDDGTIAWHYILTSEKSSGAFEGFAYANNCNMWKNTKLTTATYYAHTGNWVPTDNPMTLDPSDLQNIKVGLPDATDQQWQAQVKLYSDLTTNAATPYDFSTTITSDKDLAGATVKLVKHGDDNTYYFADRVDLKAGEPYLFFKSNMAGIDMDKVDLILDFGGNTAGTNVSIQNTVLKEHSCDDGTKAPEVVDNVMNWDYSSANNLWKVVDAGEPETFFFYADANWTPYPETPGYVHSGDTYTLTLPLATVAQWQAQFALRTSIAAAMADKYNFYCVLHADQDMKGVTVKLVQTDESETVKHDTNFFFAKQVDLSAGEDYIFKQTGVSLPLNDAHALSLFFDFGGNPVNSKISISKIYLEKVK